LAKADFSDLANANAANGEPRLERLTG
jgi:hypothetical protein